MTELVPEFIYKIVTRAAFETACRDSAFPQMPVDQKDGFVHFSTASQLAETLRLHFAGQDDLVVFAVRPSGLADLRWEPSRGGQLFPHGYGVLPASAIGPHVAISVPTDGRLKLPDWIR